MSGYKDYQKILPQHFPSIRVCSVRGNTSVVEEHLNLGGCQFVIMAKHVTQEPVLNEIFVIGGDIKGSHIHQQFIKLAGGKETKIIIHVNLKLKGRTKIMDLLGRDRFKQGYAKILDDFIAIAEDLT